MAKFNVSLLNCKGISKNTGLEYTYLNIDIVDTKGHKISIMDFKGAIPFDVVNVECEIIKNDKGRYIITEFDYYIPYQYNLAMNVLINHNERKEGN